MMTRIMKPRAAALALAAPLLFTAPALADPSTSSKSVRGSLSIQTETGGLHLTLGDRGYRSYGYDTRRYHRYGDRYGYDDRRDVRRMKRRAIRACRRAIRAEADYLGFHDVDFDDGRYAERIGPRGFRVTFNEVEFETRRREIERPVTCIVRRGDQVREIYGIPERRPRGHRRGQRGYY